MENLTQEELVMFLFAIKNTLDNAATMTVDNKKDLISASIKLGCPDFFAEALLKEWAEKQVNTIK